jgi:hypothetical protein
MDFRRQLGNHVSVRAVLRNLVTNNGHYCNSINGARFSLILGVAVQVNKFPIFITMLKMSL